ncbi:helix-turn-helix domain-containing protein [Natranaerobius thermophilus]|uniref:Transcriptional regulator, XRE family n=1 Tax=Natranaerobius thermophilus (strain ATCC BAA-1301 / DSM 18059 / JW/NM-WN-LF) TaxID=457570 RepID=B2A1T2_NATTJ|nr:XRE family transcriptional regulator [Natranaerobius thermophilus]ACB86129.1 transcriptional regulator, XRE family [Natranaerobius thermophilus JW/NM-WN-LF]
MSKNYSDTEINLSEIGETIKKLRQTKDLKLKDVSEETGISTGLLSQIERGQVQASLGSLWKISKALEVPLGSFFEELNREKVSVVRKEDRKQLDIPRSNVIYQLLSPDMNRKIEMLLVTLKSGEVEEHEKVTHEGEECGLVIKGKLGITVGDETITLEEGDSAYFDSTIPHRFFNPGDEESISVWAMTPPSF